MICCGHCGTRNFKAEKEVIDALRGAACHDLPVQTQERLRAIADGVSDGIDWRAVAIALAVKFGGQKGQALVGGGTAKWAADKVHFRVDRDGDALHLHWDAPALNGSGESCR